MDMQLRLLKNLVMMLVVLAATVHAPAMARPAEPEARHVFGAEVGRVDALVLNSKAVYAFAPSGDLSSKGALIDGAMSELFAGDLAIRSGTQAVRSPRNSASLAGLRQPADWRSQEAWGAFLLEAQQQTATGPREGSANAVKLQMVSMPDASVATAPRESAPLPDVQPLQPDTAQPAVQLVATQPDHQQQHAEAVVRVSASSVEVRAIEMIAPVGRVSGAADQPNRGLGNGLSGQITGSVFIDRDGDGQPGRGEVRLEAQPVSLMPLDAALVPVQHRTAAFGQFGFDALEPGAYLLTVSIGWDEISVPVEIAPGTWSQRVDIAVPPNLAAPKSGSLVAENSYRPTG
ncbi:hypothetical protein [Henriciella algicola]|uniref:SD-repeat containing protein B domain-containing protein n=1 Tax=Henriciella algicola TaxID=1608422 RepID=A0A399RGT7_9PROT|nr:hypothetical protein [Henriciella algicola]RIJ29055.1 hypothetical protein D1222_11885 [Henriciella algicola]